MGNVMDGLDDSCTLAEDEPPGRVNRALTKYLFYGL